MNPRNAAKHKARETGVTDPNDFEIYRAPDADDSPVMDEPGAEYAGRIGATFSLVIGGAIASIAVSEQHGLLWGLLTCFISIVLATLTSVSSRELYGGDDDKAP